MKTHKIEFAISMFDGTGDFGIWKKRMLAHLSVRGLKDVLTPQPKDSNITKDEDGKMRTLRRSQLKMKNRGWTAMRKP